MKSRLLSVIPNFWLPSQDLPRCQRCCEMRLASGTKLRWPTSSQLPYHTSQAGCALKHTSPALACCKQKPWAPTVPQVVSYFLWLDC